MFLDGKSLQPSDWKGKIASDDDVDWTASDEVDGPASEVDGTAPKENDELMAEVEG